MGRLKESMRVHIPHDIPIGEVKMSDISLELDTPEFGQRTLDQADGRDLVDKPTLGTEISLDDFRGTGTGVLITEVGSKHYHVQSTGVSVYEVYPEKIGVGWVDGGTPYVGGNWANFINEENIYDEDFDSFGSGDMAGIEQANIVVILAEGGRLVDKLRCKVNAGNTAGVRWASYYNADDVEGEYLLPAVFVANTPNAILDVEWNLNNDTYEVLENTGWSLFIPVLDLVINNVDWIPAEIGQSQQVSLTWTPEDATDKAVTYVSDNPTAFSVEAGGLIRCLARGTANITATSDENPSATDSMVCQTLLDETDRLNFSGSMNASTFNQDVYTANQSRTRVFWAEIVSNTYSATQTSQQGYHSNNAICGVQLNSAPTNFNTNWNPTSAGTKTHGNGRLFTGDGSQTINIRTHLFSGGQGQGTCTYASISSHAVAVDVNYLPTGASEPVTERLYFDDSTIIEGGSDV